jgi:peptide-methionine (R)-S-oxide reductase
MTRRGLLQGMLVTGLWNALTGRSEAAQAGVKDMKGVEELQKNWKSYLAEGHKAPLPTEPLKLSKEEWRKRLAPDAYKVLREEGTERAGTSPLDREKREGVFVCAGCDLPVYTSAMKYDSGTD